MISMFCDRENESVGVQGAATRRHGTVRVRVTDARSSWGARRKRLFRFASSMIIPTCLFFLSSWHRRRCCAVAVGK
jgi:hypothetical protein